MNYYPQPSLAEHQMMNKAREVARCVISRNPHWQRETLPEWFLHSSALLTLVIFVLWQAPPEAEPLLVRLRRIVSFPPAQLKLFIERHRALVFKHFAYDLAEDFSTFLLAEDDHTGWEGVRRNSQNLTQWIGGHAHSPDELTAIETSFLNRL